MTNLQNCLDEIQIYVGTYHKYNEGCLFGDWLILTEYSSIEELYKAMRELHKDEHDPEFMLQDFQVPALFERMKLISESHISPNIYNVFEKLERSAYNIEVLSAYVDCFGCYVESIDELIEKVSETYQGEFNDDEEFTGNLLREMDCIPRDLPSYIYIDWESTARDVMMDYSASNDHYFRCM